MPTDPTERLVDELSQETGGGRFSGVVMIHRRGQPLLELANGLADRVEARPMTIGTRLATASGTKGFTALAAVSLIEEGVLSFDTRLRDLVGDELPNVDPGVTIEHLLGHTSGVGDYLDEDELDDIDEYVLDVPVHTLQGPDDYVAILNRYRQTDPPGTRFAYNNSGYIMLALAIERATGTPYHDQVRQRVFAPADMAATEFLRSDRLPADTAIGYLSDGRTNMFHLPVIGTGDGGAYTTAADMLRFWDALLGGRIVGPALVEPMTVANRAFHDPASADEAYGLGFWIRFGGAVVQLEGMDAGVSLRSGAERATGLRYCLIANNSADVWPLARLVDRHLRPPAG